MGTDRWYGGVFACLALLWMLAMRVVLKERYARTRTHWPHARLVWAAGALGTYGLGTALSCIGIAIISGLSGPISAALEWMAALLGALGVLAFASFIALTIVERARYGKP